MRPQKRLILSEFANKLRIINFDDYFLGDGDGCFSIDEFSGMISTKKLLDREIRERYELVVMATDQSLEEQKSSTVPVQVLLEDVQDSKPVFRNKLYSFTIPENDNSAVGSVSADLADANFQHTMRYSISKNERNLFTIDMERGVIHVRRELDYEEQSKYELKVKETVL